MAVITISRQPGSLGDEVAQTLAGQLGYRLIRRPDLAALASGFGEPGELANSPELRERSPSFWERLNEERRRYASVLRNSVLQLAEEDDVVVVGLGAGMLLRGLRHVLRVQLVAPMDLRLQRVTEHGMEEHPGPLTRDRARELIRHRDREAAGYMRYLFSVDWLEPQNWDLVLNTGRFSVEEAANVLASVVRTGALATGPEDRRRLENLTLGGRIEAALLTHPSVWVNGLKIKAEDGRVLLEGEVIAEEDRDAVEQVVRALPGVESVENDLRIQPPPLTGM